MTSSTIPRRISCAGLIKIVHEDKILGSLNENSLSQVKFVYTPPGGSFHYIKKDTRHYLEEELGLTFEKDGKDLRLKLQEPLAKRRTALESFASWFARRTRRERIPSREMREELVNMLQIFSLERYGFPKLDFVGTARIQLRTSRSGQEGELTEYFWELFEAHLTHISRKLLLKGLKERYPFAQLLTVEEIARGITDNEIQVQYENHNYKGRIPIARSFNYLIGSKAF
jgi:hypothetical protein